MRKVLMAICLLPLMANATTYYVNGTTGWDGNSGTSESSPKATIQAAIDASSSGDTILVAAGTYDPINAVGKVLTIRGVSGAAKTIIDGKGAKRCALLSLGSGWFGPPSETSGAFDTVLEGFTLVNGRTSTMRDADVNEGGGVRGGSLVGCDIRQCFAYLGGGASDAKLYGCKVVENAANDDAGGCHRCLVYDSLICRNTALNEYGGGAGSAATASVLYNCTLTQNVAYEKNCNSVGAIDYYMSAYNCIVWANVTDKGREANITSAWGEYYGDNINNYTSDPHFVDAANGDYRLAADSPCIDAGDNSYVTSETDLDGNSRIVNGKVDIGCYEYGSSGDSLLDGLVAWYKFDGNANDSSGNGNDLVGPSLSYCEDSHGRHSCAGYFDGTKYLTPCADVSVQNSLTISLLAKPDEDFDDSMPETLDTASFWSQPQFVLYPSHGGYAYTEMAGVGLLVGKNGVVVMEHSDCYYVRTLVWKGDISSWTHVAVTIADNGAPRLFVNGAFAKDGLCSVKTKRIGMSTWSDDVSSLVGGGRDGYYAGAMDDLRIYNRALTAAEVKSLYDGDPDPSPVRHSVTFVLGTHGTKSGGGELSQTVEDGASATAPSVSADAGYRFTGWDCSFDEVTSDLTVTAQYEAIRYNISYAGVKGGVNPNPTSYTIEDAVTFSALPDVTGYRFTGWSLSSIAQGSMGDKTITAQYEAIRYGISYAGVKGGANPNPTSYTIEDSVTFSALPDVTGYRFTGWSPRSIARGTTGNKTAAAQYAPIAYSISYANTMGAANPNPTSYTIESSVTFAPLADVDGWKFAGWSFSGISRGTTGNLTVSANWEKVTPAIIPDDDEPMDAGVANTYDGVIVDADGLPLGYVTVKAAKASGKGESMKSKVTVTIQMVGEAKKVTVKGDVNVAEATLEKAAPDGRMLDLLFTHDTISGTFDDYAIEGVRNLLASTAKGDKGSEAKKKAEAVYNRLKGNYVMAFGDEYGYNGLSVSVGAKGKVKISGKLADGTTVATTSQLIVGEDVSCIPVIYTKKTASLAFNVYFSNDGAESEVFGYYEAVISPVTGLDSGCEFVVSENVYDVFEERGYLLADEFLPYGVSVEQKGTKWIVAGGAKAGKIKVMDGEIVDTAESENPSGLKLTFTSKTGAFKGSFKVYALDAKDKLKTFTATVSGIVVDGYGYGSATIKGVGTVAVTIMN